MFKGLNSLKKIFIVLIIGVLAISAMSCADTVFAPSNDTENGGNDTKVNDTKVNDTEDDKNETIIINITNDTNVSKDFAKLIIWIVTDKSTYEVGDIAEIEIWIQNTGNVDLSNVNIASLLPEGMEFISTETGITRNNYDANSGVWAVNNLRLEAHGGFNDASMLGIKRIKIRARVTEKMAGKNINIVASVLSATGANGQDASGASSSKFFNVNPRSSSGDNNQKSNSTDSGNNPLKGKNSTKLGANHTNKGINPTESKNVFDNVNSGNGLLDLINRDYGSGVHANESNSSLGAMITKAMDSSNPSLDKPTYEIRNLSESGSETVGTESIITLVIAIAILSVVMAGYFYGVRRK